MTPFRWLGERLARLLRRRKATEQPVARDQLELMLEEAKYLLHYAVEAGIEVDPAIANRIIAGTRLGPAVWASADAGDLVAAITRLAKQLHPVTAETLRACRDEANEAISDYKRIVYWLAVFIFPLSIVSFIYTGISNTINGQLKTANDLAVTLHQQMDTREVKPTDLPPPGSVSQLQQFAVTMRAMYSRAGQLNVLTFDSVWDPLATRDDRKTPASNHERKDAEPKPPSSATSSRNAWSMMEIDPKMDANSLLAVRSEVERLTKVYQDVRLYAANVQDQTSVIWGAISACFLPVLYALLGACAAVLRAFSKQVEARTFAPSYATPARFVIAGIGGSVVGLFNNFTIGQGLSLSPLAVAFLIGYATDIFFSFLEGSTQNLDRGKSS